MGRGVKSKKITSSGELTSKGNRILVFGVQLVSGTTASSITLKDGGSSGTEKAGLLSQAESNVGDKTSSVWFASPVEFNSGCYATLGGTGAYAYVQYQDLSG